MVGITVQPPYRVLIMWVAKTCVLSPGRRALLKKFEMEGVGEETRSRFAVMKEHIKPRAWNGIAPPKVAALAAATIRDTAVVGIMVVGMAMQTIIRMPNKFAALLLCVVINSIGSNCWGQRGRDLILSDMHYAATVLPRNALVNLPSPLPAAYSLKRYCPVPADQEGEVCFAYAVGYAGATIALRVAGRLAIDTMGICSPGFLVRLCKPRRWFANRHCNKSGHIADAAAVLAAYGIVPVTQYPDACSCRRVGPLWASAAKNRLTPKLLSVNVADTANLVARIKNALAAGCPVVVSFLDFQSFDDCWGKSYWSISPQERATVDSASVFHAACIVGYNDERSGGVFELMNSWGERWGTAGFIDVPYNDLAFLTSVAIALSPE